MAAPTQEEIIILAKFRESLADLDLSDEQKCNMFLLAWLRARDLDVQKAGEMLRKSLTWRKENDIANVMTWNPPESYKKDFPFEVCGQCPDGTPVTVLNFGKWDVRKTVENGNKERWLRYIDKMFWTTITAMKKANETIRKEKLPITQCILIVDFDEYSMRQLTSVSSVQTILECVGRFESNYPEILQAMYFINAPRVFSIFFAIIKPVMSARTLDKIQIFTHNKTKWKPVLLANIPADQLPCALGGTNMTSCLFLRKGSLISTSDDNDGLLSTEIGAGKDFKMEFDVRKIPTVLIWTFQSDDFDIGFSIQFNEKKEVLAYRKYDANIKESGSLTCDQPGKYTIIFDNTYSKIRSKKLHYIVNKTNN